jgi:hypothetical protein
MSKVLKEIKVITGSYTNKNDEKKNRYSTIGSIIETSNGPMLKIDTIPLVKGGWEGWAYINEPLPKDDGGVPHPQPNKVQNKGNFDNMDDDFPF